MQRRFDIAAQIPIFALRDIPCDCRFDLIYSRAMLQHLPRDTVSDVLRIFNASGGPIRTPCFG